MNLILWEILSDHFWLCCPDDVVGAIKRAVSCNLPLNAITDVPFELLLIFFSDASRESFFN